MAEHTIEPLSIAWSRGVATQIARDATGDPNISTETTLEEAGFITPDLRRGYKKDVQNRVVEWEHKIRLADIKANKDTKIREVGDAVFDNAKEKTSDE